MKKVEQKIQNSYHDNLLHFGAKCQCLRRRSNLLHDDKHICYMMTSFLYLLHDDKFSVACIGTMTKVKRVRTVCNFAGPPACTTPAQKYHKCHVHRLNRKQPRQLMDDDGSSRAIRVNPKTRRRRSMCAFFQPDGRRCDKYKQARMDTCTGHEIEYEANRIWRNVERATNEFITEMAQRECERVRDELYALKQEQRAEAVRQEAQRKLDVAAQRKAEDETLTHAVLLAKYTEVHNMVRDARRGNAKVNTAMRNAGDQRQQLVQKIGAMRPDRLAHSYAYQENTRPGLINAAIEHWAKWCGQIIENNGDVHEPLDFIFMDDEDYE